MRSYSDAAQRLARQSNMMKSLSQGLKVARNEDILCFLFFSDMSRVQELSVL